VLPVGTRSVLFGAHQFILHPLFLFVAWWRLYGFPWDMRLWFCFFVHDLGYLGKPNMDGPEGERHVLFGADLAGRLFGPEWADLCRYHSRFWAKKDGKPFSRLCVADKLSVAMMPAWLYLPLANLSGEVHEYMALADARHAAGEPRFQGKYSTMNVWASDQQQWFANVTEYLRRWVAEHRDGRIDTWTPAAPTKDALEGASETTPRPFTTPMTPASNPNEVV
jgi:hypothetical protein